MEWYESDVRGLEKEAKELPRNAAVFYGSSSIRMWETLAADLASDAVVNRGFGGSTLEACAYFFARLVVPLWPCSLVLYAGDNDLGDGRSPEQVFGFFRSFMAKFDALLPGRPFAFISVKPSPARRGIVDRIRKVNDLVRADIEERGNGYFIDVFSPMLQADGTPRPDLYLADGLHLSAAGYRVWTQQIWPYRKHLLIGPTPDSHTNSVPSLEGESGISQVVQHTAKP
ncbi:MAG TPA: SGNH/GDSL hydrolase family protein [Bryobacteraceae bacterium]|jgi:lysophospholipase L1-like esterase|nr:SGNH/GDSL hydrolase family protein [Bryobacteraceae bacterium]